MALGANHTITQVNLKLNPDPAWGTRTQNVQILGRDQAASTYTNLMSAATYQFVQSDNVVEIPVTTTTADVQLRFNSNTGAPGAPVSFTVAVHNRGTTASSATTVTRLVVDGTSLNTSTASVAAGATTNVTISGTWIAAGGATITATADATNVITETNETNNSFAQAIVVGRGAAVPYTEYEAEAASYQGTLLTADPLRTFGHTNFATESSGRQSVRLGSTGQYVEFTSTNAANSIVVRNSIPDAPGGGGIGPPSASTSTATSPKS